MFSVLDILICEVTAGDAMILFIFKLEMLFICDLNLFDSVTVE